MTRVLLILLGVFLVSSCAQVQKTSSFDTSISGPIRIGKVEDATGLYQSKNIVGLMSRAMQQELLRRGAHNSDAQLSINIEIVEYEPGSTLKRWVGSGGGVLLSLKADVRTPEISIGIVSVTVTVDGGGLYSAGADESIFNDAAEAVAYELFKTRGNTKLL